MSVHCLELPPDVLGKRTGWGAVCTARRAHPMPRSAAWRRPSANPIFAIISYLKIDSCARIGFVSYFPFASLLASPKRAHRFLVLFYTPVPSFPSMGDPKSLQVLGVSTRDPQIGLGVPAKVPGRPCSSCIWRGVQTASTSPAKMVCDSSPKQQAGRRFSVAVFPRFPHSSSSQVERIAHSYVLTIANPKDIRGRVPLRVEAGPKVKVTHRGHIQVAD